MKNKTRLVIQKIKQYLARYDKPAVFLGGFALIGLVTLALSFALSATGKPVVLEPENGTVTNGATTKSDDPMVQGSYIAFGSTVSTTSSPTPSPSSGSTVSIPSSAPSGQLTNISGDKPWGMTSCASNDPICIFTWQEGDMYPGSGNGSGRHCGCAEIRNVQTGALIKKINVMEMAGAPQNGYRPYPIYNPTKKQWLIVTQSTRLGWNGDQSIISRPYGFIVDINGNFVGSAIELSSHAMNGWVPHGVFDTATQKYFVQWHQQVQAYNKKDMFASVVDANGTVTHKDFNINNSPDSLDEYGTAVYNSDSGEIVSIHSSSLDNDCKDCTRFIDVFRLKIGSDGKLAQVGSKNRIDTDDQIEWGLHASYNPVAKSIVVLFREGTTMRTGGGLTGMQAMVLDGQGAIKAGKVNLGSTADAYWTAGTACSAQTNVCIGTFQDKAVYVDANSTGTTKISAVGTAVKSFGMPSSRAAYSPVTDKFYIYGVEGYITAAGR